ncbi:ABC transporter ATP-binding protein, partial [Clostridia bacterium OttesenSCG-928-O13]|nr:ABC transporter ATP-binding protein [Clostridia bacterium OttesenSCG-928-O13]
LKDVSFNVPGGSIVGFVGENGAGKTTTIKAILDIIRKDAGTVTLLGQDSTSSGALAHSDIGVVFDECSFHDWLRADQVGKILKNTYTTWDDAYFAELLQRFGLSGLTGKKDLIKTYSRGMKMKLSLAAALAHRPKLLLLDEATSGLDPIVRDEILDLFLEFIRDDDHSILFSSHITSDIEKAADYLVFIHQGRIILDAEKDELLARYGVVRCGRDRFTLLDTKHVIGTRQTSFGIEALIDNRPDFRPGDDAVIDPATVDDIMLFTIRGKSA